LILAAGNLFFVATGPSSHLLSMTGRPGINLINSLTSVGLYAGLGIWLVPIYGVIGMAVVDAIVTMMLNIARVVEGKIIVGIQPFGRTFYKPLAATLVGGGVLVLLRLILGTSMSMALTSLVVAGVVYLGFLKLLGLDPEEREVIEAIKTRFASILGRRKRPPR
ncbi:MAG: polysaccharide biosynthesis C-terminal domain-containing protein, partial [Actinomycetota bacterium]